MVPRTRHAVALDLSGRQVSARVRTTVPNHDELFRFLKSEYREFVPGGLDKLPAADRAGVDADQSNPMVHDGEF